MCTSLSKCGYAPGHKKEVEDQRIKKKQEQQAKKIVEEEQKNLKREMKELPKPQNETSYERWTKKTGIDQIGDGADFLNDAINVARQRLIQNGQISFEGEPESKPSHKKQKIIETLVDDLTKNYMKQENKREEKKKQEKEVPKLRFSQELQNTQVKLQELLRQKTT